MTINEGDPALRGTARSHPPPNQGHSASDLALSFSRTHLWPLRHRPGLKLFWSHRWPLRHRQACQDSLLATPPSDLALSFPGLTFAHSATGLALSFSGLTLATTPQAGLNLSRTCLWSLCLRPGLKLFRTGYSG
jgi:hypothetical protein